jgi:hypothetical protein
MAASAEFIRSNWKYPDLRTWLAQENALPPDLVPEAARAYPCEWLKNGRAAERLAADPALSDIVGSALRRLMLEGPEDADDHEREQAVLAHPAVAYGLLVAAFDRGVATPYLERVAQLLQALCTASGFPVEALAPRTDADAAQLVRGIRLFASRKDEPLDETLVADAAAWRIFTPAVVERMGPEVLQKVSILLLGSGPHGNDPRSSNDVAIASYGLAGRQPDFVRRCLFAPVGRVTKAKGAHLSHLAEVFVWLGAEFSVPNAAVLPRSAEELAAAKTLIGIFRREQDTPEALELLADLSRRKHLGTSSATEREMVDAVLAT